MRDQTGPEPQRPGLAWEASDAADLAARLSDVVGSTVAPGSPIGLGEVSFLVRVSETGAPDQLVIVDDLGPPPDHVAVDVAIGWATVDSARAGRELVEAHVLDGPFAAAETDDILGAVACRAATSMFGCPVVLLEPTTEGRLAATLARHGEGPCAIYIDRGPGAASLRASGRPAGPHLIVRGAGYHRDR